MFLWWYSPREITHTVVVSVVSRPVSGFSQECVNNSLLTYVSIQCFRRNARDVLREILVSTNNPGTHDEYVLVHVCCKLSMLHLAVDVL